MPKKTTKPKPKPKIDGPPETIKCVRKGCPSTFVKAGKPAFAGFCSIRCQGEKR